MPREFSFRIEDDGRYTLNAPGDLVEALGLHALAGDAIRMRYAAQQQQKVQPSSPADVLAFGNRK